MRVMVIVLAIAFALLIGYLGHAINNAGAARRSQRQLRMARWRVRHYGQRGQTVVTVALAVGRGETLDQSEVLDEHIVARIDDGDAEWERRFVEARERATERAFHLNSDRPPLEG